MTLVDMVSVRIGGKFWSGWYKASYTSLKQDYRQRSEQIARIRDMWPEIARQPGAMRELRSLPLWVLRIIINQE